MRWLANQNALLQNWLYPIIYTILLTQRSSPVTPKKNGKRGKFTLTKYVRGENVAEPLIEQNDIYAQSMGSRISHSWFGSFWTNARLVASSGHTVTLAWTFSHGVTGFKPHCHGMEPRSFRRSALPSVRVTRWRLSMPTVTCTAFGRPKTKE